MNTTAKEAKQIKAGARYYRKNNVWRGLVTVMHDSDIMGHSKVIYRYATHSMRLNKADAIRDAEIAKAEMIN